MSRYTMGQTWRGENASQLLGYPTLPDSRFCHHEGRGYGCDKIVQTKLQSIYSLRKDPFYNYERTQKLYSMTPLCDRKEVSPLLPPSLLYVKIHFIYGEDTVTLTAVLLEQLGDFLFLVDFAFLKKFGSSDTANSSVAIRWMPAMCHCNKKKKKNYLVFNTVKCMYECGTSSRVGLATTHTWKKLLRKIRMLLKFVLPMTIFFVWYRTVGVSDSQWVAFNKQQGVSYFCRTLRKQNFW